MYLLSCTLTPCKIVFCDKVQSLLGTLSLPVTRLLSAQRDVLFFLFVIIRRAWGYKIISGIKSLMSLPTKKLSDY